MLPTLGVRRANEVRSTKVGMYSQYGVGKAESKGASADVG
jgi:hypothetical protein